MEAVERRNRFGCDGDIFPPKTSLSFGGNKVYLGDKKKSNVEMEAVERRNRFGCDGDIFPPKTSSSLGGN